MNARRKSRFAVVFFDILEITIITTTIFLIIYLFVGQLLEVTGDSMVPTLYDKEQVVAEKLSIKFNPLQRGDIVIFKHPEKNNRLLIKRVIALPYDNFKIINGLVYINGSPLNEPYLKSGTKTTGGHYYKGSVEYSVPERSYVLMGDNREESSDSRNIGPIREELIIGRAALVYYPFNRIRILKH